MEAALPPVTAPAIQAGHRQAVVLNRCAQVAVQQQCCLPSARNGRCGRRGCSNAVRRSVRPVSSCIACGTMQNPAEQRSVDA